MQFNNSLESAVSYIYIKINSVGNSSSTQESKALLSASIINTLLMSDKYVSIITDC